MTKKTRAITKKTIKLMSHGIEMIVGRADNGDLYRLMLADIQYGPNGARLEVEVPNALLKRKYSK